MELTFIHKKIICDIAREAYDVWPAREEFERAHSAPGLHAFNAWRHAEQLKAVGLQSLTICTEDQYLELQRHFMRLRSTWVAEVASPNLTLALF